ncbi:hypothetical protein FOXYSP1_10937 [Fusarium oxysporum f. sp. phaseoli]
MTSVGNVLPESEQQSFGQKKKKKKWEALLGGITKTNFVAHRNTAHSNPRKSLRIFTDDSGRTGPDISSRPLQ